MNDDLIYKVADAYHTDLFHVGNQVRGLIQDHKFKVGDWNLKSDITIVLDENTDKLVSAMARIIGNLWSYFIVTKQGQWMIFFDGSRVKLHTGAEAEFGLGNAKNSLKKLKPALTRVFHMAAVPAGGSTAIRWEPMDLSITDSL